MSAEFQRDWDGAGPYFALSKILFDDFTYYDDDDDDTEGDTMVDVVYEVDSDDDWFRIFINCPVQMWNNLLCLCPYISILHIKKYMKVSLFIACVTHIYMFDSMHLI